MKEGIIPGLCFIKINVMSKAAVPGATIAKGFPPHYHTLAMCHANQCSNMND